MHQYILIFLAMVIYVSLNTIRIIMVIRGKKSIASVIAAMENFIYMMTFAYAIGGETNNVISILIASGGYAVGVLTGSIVEKKLNMGHLVVQVIGEGNLVGLVEELRKENFAITNWKVSGMKGNKDMLYILVNKKRYGGLEARIKELIPNAFVVMYEPKYFYGGYSN
jgi:uncharacterized protein YebE (UPF0316 family)